MPDAARLYAKAQQAHVRSEMARSRLLVAKASLRERSVRWSSAKTRITHASRNARGFPSVPRSADQAG
jgi:hypothetical protein